VGHCGSKSSLLGRLSLLLLANPLIEAYMLITLCGVNRKCLSNFLRIFLNPWTLV
jgi:hypothetical protein